MSKKFNKKAQIGTFLTLSLAIIAIFVIFVLFMWIVNTINIGKTFFGTKTIAVTMSNNYVSFYSLKSYLSLPVEIEIEGKKESMKIIDLIRLWNIYPYTSYNYKEILSSETEKIFKPFTNKDSGMSCYYIEIKNYITETEGFKYARGGTPDSILPLEIGDRNLARLKEKATLEIPLFDDKKTTATLVINNLCMK